MTAYVPGPEAGRYGFTSALPTEILRQLGPMPQGIEDPGAAEPVEDG